MLRMTDVLAVPSSGGWVCGSPEGGFAAQDSRPCLILQHGNPPPPLSSPCSQAPPPGTPLPLFPPGHRLGCLSPVLSPPVLEEPVPSLQCAPLRGHKHIWAACAKPHKLANSCTAAPPSQPYGPF